MTILPMQTADSRQRSAALHAAARRAAFCRQQPAGLPVFCLHFDGGVGPWGKGLRGRWCQKKFLFFNVFNVTR